MTSDNPAAILGRKRWAKVSDEDRVEAMRELANKRMTAISPERRTEIAKIASRAAAKKRKAAKKSKKTSRRKSISDKD